MLLHVDCTYYFMCDYYFGLSFYHIFHGFYVRVILRISYVFCLRGNCIYVGKVVHSLFYLFIYVWHIVFSLDLRLLKYVYFNVTTVRTIFIVDFSTYIHMYVRR